MPSTDYNPFVLVRHYETNNLHIPLVVDKWVWNIVKMINNLQGRTQLLRQKAVSASICKAQTVLCELRTFQWLCHEKRFSRLSSGTAFSFQVAQHFRIFDLFVYALFTSRLSNTSFFAFQRPSRTTTCKATKCFRGQLLPNSSEWDSI
jgi:hypothetical protein